ncbi:MAG TPA: universal stress protein, partial [Thermoleophilia bacterium]|nr:universal stress protein [Thermoleophilia bacterium]
GEVADDIVEQADALHCDLIAMATHGHGTLGRLVYGSVVDKVRRASDVPLLLMNAKTTDTSEAVVEEAAHETAPGDQADDD